MTRLAEASTGGSPPRTCRFVDSNPSRVVICLWRRVLARLQGAVVLPPTRRVRQCFVGVLNSSEEGTGSALIRVDLLTQATECGPDFVRGGVLGQAQDFIERVRFHRATVPLVSGGVTGRVPISSSSSSRREIGRWEFGELATCIWGEQRLVSEALSERPDVPGSAIEERWLSRSRREMQKMANSVVRMSQVFTHGQIEGRADRAMRFQQRIHLVH